MADDVTNLLTRRSAVTAEIAALDVSAAGGRPNVSGGQGTVDHVGYKRSLYEELAQIDQLLAQLHGPFEVPLEGRPG
jgi:hypothetical protein